jgi:hypothetical protein
MVLVVVGLPLLLAGEMVTNCWVHGRTRQVCDPQGQIPRLIREVVVASLAWMATPPR